MHPLPPCHSLAKYQSALTNTAREIQHSLEIAKLNQIL